MLNGMAVGDLISAAILLCGLTFTDIANLADVLNLAMFSEKEFYDLQRDYMYPVVHTTYVRQQEVVIEYLRDNQLHLSDDGCCDSLGYSSKCATYSLIGASLNSSHSSWYSIQM